MMDTKPIKSSLAAYINWQIELSGKKQFEIAEECGFAKPNIITMIKQGKTPLPRDKVEKMAAALGVDPLNLLKMMYEEYYLSEWKMIEKVLSQPALTENEVELVNIVRSSGVKNPRMFESDKRKIAQFAKTLESE